MAAPHGRYSYGAGWVIKAKSFPFGGAKVENVTEFSKKFTAYLPWQLKIKNPASGKRDGQSIQFLFSFLLIWEK